ncbi:MAG: amidase, partial [Coriobacteriia bacterium]
MTAIDLSALSARQVRDGIVAGEFSAREAADAAYERIDALDGDVHAFLQLTPELAYEAADRIDAARAAGEELPPLAGVPAGLKDNMNLIGTRTTCASRMLADYESVYNCTAVRRLLDAGALPIGKCNMDEFAFGSSTENSAFGPTRNPWDLERVPGGSSGGSAAAVAAGMVSISLGSDTGGSIRQPAALTGTIGFKPTYGRVSRYGVVAFGSSLDQIGPFGKTVDDTALALEAISGADSMDATSSTAEVESYAALLGGDIRGLRVGL